MSDGCEGVGLPWPKCPHCEIEITSISDRAVDAHVRECPELLRRNLRIERAAAHATAAWLEDGVFLSSDDVGDLAREMVWVQRCEYVWIRRNGERVYVSEMSHRHLCNALAKLYREPDEYPVDWWGKTGANREAWKERIRDELHVRLDAYIDEMMVKGGDPQTKEEREARGFGEDLRRAVVGAWYRKEKAKKGKRDQRAF